MDIRNRRQIKDAAKHALAASAYDPKKIILIHTAVSLGLTLLANLVDFFLGQGIETTGGLSGLGMRSVLSTAQSVLLLAVSLGLPFWEAGLRFAAMKMSRGEKTEPKTLLEGFRRFGPLFRRMLLQLLLNFGIGMVCFFLAMQIYAITPLSNNLMALQPALLDPNFVPDEAFLAAMYDATLPALLLFVGIFLMAMLIVSYFFRMTDYLILDHPGMGALQAMKQSAAQMRGNKLDLLKMDLSFWWYYALQLLVALLAFGDYLTALLGIHLPIAPEVSYLLFSILSLLAQFALYVWVRNRIEVSYALVYDATSQYA